MFNIYVCVGMLVFSLIPKPKNSHKILLFMDGKQCHILWHL